MGRQMDPPCLGFSKSKMLLSLHSFHAQEHFRELCAHTNTSVMETDRTDTFGNQPHTSLLKV